MEYIEQGSGYMYKRTNNKYGATKTTVDDIVFDSYLESRHYKIIKKMLADGVIASFDRQEVIELLPGFRRNGRAVRAIKMKPDFTLMFHDGTKVYVESKGVETEDFKIKVKLLWWNNPDIRYVLAKQENTAQLPILILAEKEREFSDCDLTRP